MTFEYENNECPQIEMITFLITLLQHQAINLRKDNLIPTPTTLKIYPKFVLANSCLWTYVQ